VLARHHVSFEGNIKLLGVIGGAISLFRVIIEKFVVTFFPLRLSHEYEAQLPHPSRFHSIRIQITRWAILLMVTYTFLGICWQVPFGFGVILLAYGLGKISHKLPTYKIFWNLLPDGLPALVLNLVFGLAVGKLMAGIFGDTPEFPRMSFAFAGIPMLGLSFARALGRQTEPTEIRWYEQPKFKIIERVGGILLFVAFLKLANLI
jgi:hypothetical protein